MDGADVAGGGVRLTLPVGIGTLTSEVVLEPAHCERLFRAAAYTAVRTGAVAPDAPALTGRLVAGDVRERHGEVLCLDSCAVEVVNARGRIAGRTEFPRAAFIAFAAARAAHLLAGQAAAEGEPVISFSLHARPAGEEPFPIALPALARLSVGALAAGAEPSGAPDGAWIATFLSPSLAPGLDELERASRTSGVEATGCIRARVGFDPERGCFVRILDRLVVSRAARATATTVVSTAASWGEFLDAGENGAQAHSSAHTHLEGQEPCLSLQDIVTHYTTFPDPLSAALIVALHPGGRELALYGYTPGAQLRREPGHWTLPA